MENLQISRERPCCLPLKSCFTKVRVTLLVVLLLGMIGVGYALHSQAAFMAKHLKETLAIGGVLTIVVLGGAIGIDVSRAKKTQNKDQREREVGGSPDVEGNFDEAPALFQDHEWGRLEPAIIEKLGGKGIHLQLMPNFDKIDCEISYKLLEALPKGHYYVLFVSTGRWALTADSIPAYKDFCERNKNGVALIVTKDCTTDYVIENTSAMEMCEVHTHTQENYSKKLLDQGNRAQIAKLKRRLELKELP